MLQEEQKSPPEDFLDILAQLSQQGPLGGLLTLPGLEDNEEVETVKLAALPPRKPWWRRRGIIFAPISLVIAILLIIVLPGILSAMVLLQFQTVPVTEGNLSRTVTASGPLQGITYDINFTGSGKIAEIDVAVGQHVTQGQLLAKLDLTSLQDAVNHAQAAYQIALTVLKGDIASSKATLGQGGAFIAAAQTALDNAEANLAATESEGQTSVGVAQTTLNNDEASLATAQQQAQASIKTALATLESTALPTTTATAISTVSGCTLVSATTTGVGTITTSTTTTYTWTSPCPPTMTTSIAPTSNCTLTAATTGFSTATGTTTYTWTCFCTPTTVGQPVCTTAQATYQEAVATANGTVTTAQEAVNAAESGLADAEAMANTKNITAQAAVNAAQRALNTTIANANLSNTTANVDIKNATSLAQGELITLNTAEHNLQNAILTAPHAGIVTVINGTIGGTPGVPTSVSVSTTGTSGTFIQIVDPSSNLLQVIADVSESNVTHLMVGDTVQFTVIAYGKREFTGVVSAISPNGTTVADMVSFPVAVNVDTNDLQGATLLPGMTATIKIKVVERVLLIPATAVSFAHTATTPFPANGGKPLITAAQALMATTQAQTLLQQLLTQNPAIRADMPMATFVLVPSSTPGQAVAKPVVLGLLDSNNNYEVLAGLTSGELVIVGVS